MMRKKSVSPSEIITAFQKIIKRKPSVKKMYADIRLMQFRIRPIEGDITKLDVANDTFIEMLWSLGKLDEVFQKRYLDMDGQNREVVYDIFEKLYDEYQSRLNKATYRKESSVGAAPKLEMEIYRELPHEKKLN